MNGNIKKTNLLLEKENDYKDKTRAINKIDLRL